MKYRFRNALAITTLAALASMSQAQIDGKYESAYGQPLAVQNTQTGFGDSSLGLVNQANGSEIDSIYGYISGGQLHLLITGNIETNYNKLNVFIDTGAAFGQNRLVAPQSDWGFDALKKFAEGPGGEGDPNPDAGPGLTFDTGFNACYYFNFNGGGDGGGGFNFYGDYIIVGDPASGAYGQFQAGGVGNGDPIAGFDRVSGGGVEAIDWKVTVDNSNVAGVTGGTGAGDGSGVTTGVEYQIPLSRLGNPTGPIRVMAFIASDSNLFLANQVIPGIGGGDNLGNPRNVNFQNIPGNQYVTISQGQVDVPPSGFTIFRGALVSGGLAELLSSDDQYLVVRNGPIAFPNESPITIYFDGTYTGGTKTAVSFKIENKVSISGLTQIVDMFNYTTNSYDTTAVDTRPAPTTDTVVKITGSGDINRFFGTGGALRSRLRVRPAGPLFTNNWRTSVDQVQWVVGS